MMTRYPTLLTLGMVFISVLMSDVVSAKNDTAGDGMGIVLTDRLQTGQIFVAKWLGDRLGEPQLVGDVIEPGSQGSWVFGSSAVGTRIVLVTEQSEQDRKAFYYFDGMTGQREKVAEAPERTGISIALAPDLQRFAFLRLTTDQSRRELSVPDSRRSYDIMVYDPSAKQLRSLVNGRAAFSLSWSPDGKTLTYDTWDGFIESIDMATAKTVQLFQGREPSWAPDGQRLAFQSDETSVKIYNVGSKGSKEIHNRKDKVRYFMKQRIVGPIYWSPDGRYLSFQVERWTLAYGSQPTCVVLDVTSQKEFSYDGDGRLNCGPWVPVTR